MSGNNPNIMFWIRDAETRRQVETETAIRMAEAVARPWAEHMSYMMGARDTDNKYGKFIMGIGKSVSRMFVNTSFGKKEPSIFAKYSMVATFALLYVGSKMFTKTSSKKTDKVWGLS
jgi:hypothetical protein